MKLKQEEIIIVIQDYLKQNRLIKSMRALEEETGTKVESYGKEVDFFRDLILEGQWEDAERYLEPLVGREDFDLEMVMFEIRKQKFLELLDSQALSPAVMELVDNLKVLEGKCSKEEFNSLCYCLTVDRVQDHPSFAHWTPYVGRLECFHNIKPHFDRIFSSDWLDQKERLNRVSPNHLLTLLAQAVQYQLAIHRQENESGDLPENVQPSLLSSEIEEHHFGDVDRESRYNVKTSHLNLPRGNNKLVKITDDSRIVQQGGGNGSPFPRSLSMSSASILQNKSIKKSKLYGSINDINLQGERERGLGGGGVLNWSRLSVKEVDAVRKLLSSTGHIDVPETNDDTDDPKSPVDPPVSWDIPVAGAPTPLNRKTKPSNPPPNVNSHNNGGHNAGDSDSGRHESGRISDSEARRSSASTLSGNSRRPSLSGGPPPSIVGHTSTGGVAPALDTLKTPAAGSRRPSLTGAAPDLSEASSLTAPGPGRDSSGVPAAQRRSSTAAVPPVLAVDTSAPRASTTNQSSRRPSHSTAASVEGLSGTTLDPVPAFVTPPPLEPVSNNSIVYRYPEMNVTLGNSTASVSASMDGNSHILKNDFPASASSITKSQLVNPDGFVGNLSFATMLPKDTASFHPVGILREVQAVRAVAFDPSGSFLAVGTNSRAIRICNVPSLKGSSFSRQGEESAVKLDENSSLSLLDVAYERNEHHLGSVYCLAWSPRSSLIATGSNDKMLKVMRVYKEYYGSRHVLQSNSEEDLTLHGHSGTIRSVAFSHTHPNTLISGGAGDNALRVWDIESSSTNSEPMLALSGHKDAIFNISTVPGDASLIVSSGADNIVRLWDLRTGSTVSKMATYDSVQGISVTKRYGTTLIATGHADHSVSVWDFSMKKRLFQMTEHRGECRSVHFSPCSRWLLSGSFDGVINITDTENHLPVHSFNDHANKVLQVMWHPAKPIFASSSADKSVCLWAPVTRQ